MIFRNSINQDFEMFVDGTFFFAGVLDWIFVSEFKFLDFSSPGQNFKIHRVYFITLNFIRIRIRIRIYFRLLVMAPVFRPGRSWMNQEGPSLLALRALHQPETSNASASLDSLDNLHFQPSGLLPHDSA
jgi:hypothetical protein